MGTIRAVRQSEVGRLTTFFLKRACDGHLSDQQAELLARDGYVILPAVFTHDEIHSAMENWERICASDAARPNLLTNDAGILGHATS